MRRELTAQAVTTVLYFFRGRTRSYITLPLRLSLHSHWSDSPDHLQYVVCITNRLSPSSALLCFLRLARSIVSGVPRVTEALVQHRSSDSRSHRLARHRRRLCTDCPPVRSPSVHRIHANYANRLDVLLRTQYHSCPKPVACLCIRRPIMAAL